MLSVLHNSQLTINDSTYMLDTDDVISATLESWHLYEGVANAIKITKAMRLY